MRRAANIDGNHREVVEALRAVGAEVTSLASMGGGVADLLVSRAGSWYVIEVKDGRKPPSARQLTQDQLVWIARQRAEVAVVRSVEDALAAVGLRENRWRDALGDA